MTKFQIYRIIYITTGIIVTDKIFDIIPYKNIDRFVIDVDKSIIKFFINGTGNRKLVFLKDYEEK